MWSWQQKKKVQRKTHGSEVAQNQAKLEGRKMIIKPRKWTDVNTSIMDILVYLSYFSFSIHWVPKLGNATLEVTNIL